MSVEAKKCGGDEPRNTVVRSIVIS